MTRTDRPTSGTTTFHRDGTITVWDCIRGEWTRGDDPPAALLATLGRDERARVVAHVGGLTTKWRVVRTRPYVPVTADDGAAAGNVVDVERRRRGDEILERHVARNGRHEAIGAISLVQLV